MKTVRLLGNNKLEVVDLPEPTARDNWVVVKVMACTICGTERHFFEDGIPREVAQVRENAGHDAAGIVVRVDSSRLVREGDRVILFAARQHCGKCEHCYSGRWIFCQGEGATVNFAADHSQYVLVRDDFCLPLSDDVDFEVGAMLMDTLATPFRAIRRVRVTGEDRVLVVGQGPIGLAATMLCRFFGAAVIGADINNYRLGYASRCGARAVVNPAEEDLQARVRALTSHEGVSVAIDASGSEEGRAACLAAVRPGGRVAFVGVGGGLHLDPNQASDAFIRKEIELHGSWFADPSDVTAIVRMMRRGLDPSAMISHRFPIASAAQAFETSFGPAGAKVVVLPWEN